MRAQPRMAGFSLLELLIGMGFVAILLTTVLPVYEKKVLDSRISSATTDLVGSLALARAEAAGRRQMVTICTADETGTACAGNGGWQRGWLVFVDSDADGVRDRGEEIVYAHGALDANITAAASGDAAERVSYRPNGTTTLTAAQTLVLCDQRGFGQHARGIYLSILGTGSGMLATDTPATGCLVGNETEKA